MASIERRGSSWEARYRDEQKKSRRKAFKRKVDATKFLHQVQADLDSGQHISAERGAITVDRWVKQCIEARIDLEQTTRDRNYSIWLNHIRGRWATRKLSEVTHNDVQSWINDLSKAGLAARTVRKVGFVLSGALDQAVRDRRIPSNPAMGVKYPKAPPAKQVFLTTDQVNDLVAVVHDREKLIVYTLAYTGLRWGELAGLRVRDVNVLRRRLNVEQTLVWSNGRAIAKAPKSNEIRSVPTPGFLMDLIAPTLAEKRDDDKVFTSPEGGLLRGNNERRRWFDRAAEAIGVPELTPHDLRHTAASLAISAGASVKAVQRMLGHADASVTLNTYAGLFEDDLDDVASRMDQARAKARVSKLCPIDHVVSLAD